MDGTPCDGLHGVEPSGANRSTPKNGGPAEVTTGPHEQGWWDDLDARMAARGILPPPAYHPDDDAPPEPRDRAIINCEFSPGSSTVAAMADGPPQPPSWWDELDAELEAKGIEPVRPTGPDPFVEKLNRLSADLDAHPDCSTLEAMATRDRATGALLGIGYRVTPLEHAYTSGAPAELIVEAERLAAFLGKRGTPGYRHRAVRMAHRVRQLNRQLAPFNGLRRTLGTVTVVWSLSLPVGRATAACVALVAAADAARRAVDSLAGANAPPGSGADPPPLDSASIAPLLRTGPPGSRVRVAA